jgi:putative SOS response-associated peptidase YedK
MCGRFNQTASGDELAEAFSLDDAPELAPRFNIAPTQPVAVVGVQPKTGRRGLASLRWGFVPRSSLGDERGFINARSETAWEKPSFREAFVRRRCLIPATGFYEWRRAPGFRPQPWLYQMADGKPFAFAGLWQPALASGASTSCLILTTEPNTLAREVHDRMPVILAPEDYAAWLDPSTTSATRLQPLLRPFPPQAMSALPLSMAVNDPAVDDPSCLEPVPREPPLRR